MSKEISDDEAMFWLDNNCLSFTIGTGRGFFQGSFNVDEGGLIEAAKLAMIKFQGEEAK